MKFNLILKHTLTLLEEQSIIALCKEDLSHFTSIYDAYMSDVYRYVYAKTHNHHKTEDIVSQTFLLALENILGFVPQNKSIKCWLFVIARNLIYKSSQKPQLLDLESVGDVVEQDRILDQIIDAEMFKNIQLEIDKLDEVKQEVLRLKIWEDLTFNEIAEIMEISTSSAKMCYYRTIEKITQELRVKD